MKYEGVLKSLDTFFSYNKDLLENFSVALTTHRYRTDARGKKLDVGKSQGKKELDM